MTENKYIKKHTFDYERIYGMSFQSDDTYDRITYAISSMNSNSDNEICVVSLCNDFKDGNKDTSDSISEENMDALNQKMSDINIEEDIKKEEEPEANISNEITCSVKTQYPSSSIKFCPYPSKKDLLITTSVDMKVYSYNEGAIAQSTSLKDGNLALTSCDWSKINVAKVAVCGIEEKCSVFDLEKFKNEVTWFGDEGGIYDISYVQGQNSLVYGGERGSLLFFDLREKNADIQKLYQCLNDGKIMRIHANKISPNLILVVSSERNHAFVIDLRKSVVPVAYCKKHTGAINNAVWAPGSNSNILSVSDDKKAYIFDTYTNLPYKTVECVMEYDAGDYIENCAWDDYTKDWVGLVHGKTAEILKVS